MSICTSVADDNCIYKTIHFAEKLTICYLESTHRHGLSLPKLINYNNKICVLFSLWSLLSISLEIIEFNSYMYLNYIFGGNTVLLVCCLFT